MTNLITFYNEATACVDNRRALGVVLLGNSLDLSRPLTWSLSSLLVAKLVRFGLGKWSVK